MQPTAAQLQTTGGKAVEGAWYGGQRYLNGSLLAPGQDQAGHDVSQEVIAQTNPGNVAYVNQQRTSAGLSPSPSTATPAPVNPNPTNSTGNTTGSVSGTGNAPAVPNLTGLYDSLYTNNPDVKTANTAITNLQGQIAAKSTARDTAIGGENDNPFYSEATRVGRVQKINDNYNNDVNTLNGQLSTAQTNLTNLQAEAQRQVNLAQGQYSLNNQAYQQNLQEFNTLLSAGGLENADPNTLAQISVSTGIPTGMLQSIQSSQQAKNTQIVTSTDNSGNLTISAVNSQTGKIVSSQTLGGVGKSSGGSAGTIKVGDGLSAMTPKILSQLNSYGNIGPQQWNQALSAWMSAGLQKSDFVSNYGQYADTNRGDFLQAYGFANPKTATTIKSNQAQNTKPVN